MKKLIYLSFLSLLFVSCNEKEQLDCTPSILEKFQMVPYTGTEQIACMYVLKFEWKGSFYYGINGHCVDMATNPEDCNGVRLCDDWESTDCKKFFRKSTNLGIIGYEP